MDHVINDMKVWLHAYNHDEDGYKDENAVKCIQKALAELEKYYTHYNN